MTDVNLNIRMSADGSVVVRELGESERAVRKFDTATKDAASRADAMASGALRRLALAAVAAAGPAALGALVVKGFQFGEALANTSDKLGISTRSLAVFQHAAELAGVSSKTLETSIFKMSTAIGQASFTGGAAAEALTKLHLTAAQLQKLSPEQQFAKISEGLRGLATQSERAAVSQVLLGRGARELQPLIAGGAEAIAKASREVRILGLDLDDVTARKIDNAKDAFETLQKATTGLGVQLAVALAGPLQQISEAALDSIENMGGMQAVAKRLVDSLVNGLGHVADVVHGLGVVWSGLKAIVGTVGEGFYNLLATISTAGIAASNAIGSAFHSMVDGLKSAIQSILETISEAYAFTAQFALVGKDALYAVARGALEASAAIGKGRTEFKAAAAEIGGDLKRLQDQAQENGRIWREEFLRKLAEAPPSEAFKKWALDAMASADAVASANEKAADDVSKAWELTQKDLDKIFKGYTTAIDGAIAAQDKLLLELFPVQVAQANYARDLETLTAAVDRYGFSERDRAIALQNLKVKYADLHPEIAKHAAQAKEVADAWVEAGKRIDETFGDVWAGAFESFDDFADQLKDGFRQLLGELAHFAITRPILVQLGLQGGGVASALTGGAGSGGLLGQLTSAQGLAGLLKGGVDKVGGLFSGLFGGGAQAFTGSASGGVSAGVGGGISAGTGGGLSAGAGVRAGVGGFNLGGALGSLGAGLAGSFAADQLFGGREAATGFGSTAGGVLGGIFGGPLGAGVGAFAGGAIDRLLGTDVSGQRVKLGFQAGGPLAEGADETRIGASGLALTAVTRRADGAEDVAESLLDSVLAIDAALTNAARSAGLTVNLSGQSLANAASPHREAGASFFGSFAKGEVIEEDVSGAATNFVKSWLAAIDGQISARAKQFMAGVGGSAEELVKGFSAALQLDKLIDLDVVHETAKALDELGQALDKTALDQYGTAVDRVLELAGAYDGTADSLIALTEALAEQKTIAAQLALAYQSAGDEIRATTRQSATQIRESMLSERALQTLRLQQIEGLFAELATTTDPFEITALAGQIDSLATSALRLGDAYKGVGESISATFGSAIDAVRESILSEEELYNLRREQIAGLTAQISQTTDPRQLQALGQQIEQLSKGAFGLLDDPQKKGMSGEFVAFLTEAQNQLQAQLASLGGGFGESEALGVLERLEQLSQQQLALGEAELASREAGVANTINFELQNQAAAQQAAAAAQQAASAAQFAVAVASFATLPAELSAQIQAAVQAALQSGGTLGFGGAFNEYAGSRFFGAEVNSL